MVEIRKRTDEEKTLVADLCKKKSSFCGAQVCTSDLNIYVNGPSGSSLMLYTLL